MGKATHRKNEPRKMLDSESFFGTLILASFLEERDPVGVSTSLLHYFAAGLTWP